MKKFLKILGIAFISIIGLFIASGIFVRILNSNTSKDNIIIKKIATTIIDRLQMKETRIKDSHLHIQKQKFKNPEIKKKRILF